MARRVTLSTALLAGAVTLIVAISIGNAMGNHVLGAIGQLGAVSATPVAIPTPDETAGAARNWKHLSLAAVATDPGFPDPRVTPPPPPPPPPPTATPRPPSPTPSPSLTAEPQPTDGLNYTSPPLPLPLVSGAANDEPTAEASNAAPEAPPETPTPGGRRGPATRMTPNAVGP